MPLLKRINTVKNTRLLFWKIKESLEELMSIYLKEDSLARVENMRFESDKKCFLSTQHSLKEIGYSDSDLFYSKTGKPYLKDGKNISISHSFDFSCIAISDNKIGIDIEKKREKIKKIAPKFLHKTESFIELHEDKIRSLTKIWTAKESIFKIYEKNLSFRENIILKPFQLDDLKTEATIINKKKEYKHTVNFIEFEGFCCSYT